MVCSRDWLLPPFLATVYPRTQTPLVAQVLLGLIIGEPTGGRGGVGGGGLGPPSEGGQGLGPGLLAGWGGWVGVAGRPGTGGRAWPGRSRLRRWVVMCRAQATPGWFRPDNRFHALVGPTLPTHAALIALLTDLGSLQELTTISVLFAFWMVGPAARLAPPPPQQQQHACSGACPGMATPP